MSKNTIYVTSQKEPFPCCVCGETIKSYDLYMALGCHTDCGGDFGKLKIKHQDIQSVADQILELVDEKPVTLTNAVLLDWADRLTQALREAKE